MYCHPERSEFRQIHAETRAVEGPLPYLNSHPRLPFAVPTPKLTHVHPEPIALQLAPFLQASPGPGELSESLYIDISKYINILIRWNARISLTAIRSPAEIITRHFGESIFAARCLFPQPNPNTTLADLGSGAGFPGLPIKLYCPSLEVTLIESNQKKATFLREVIRTLALTGIQVDATRAGSDAAPSHKFNLVTLRAVERFDQALPTAVSLTQPTGCLALLIGSDQQTFATKLAPQIQWQKPIRLPLSKDRILLIGHKS